MSNIGFCLSVGNGNYKRMVIKIDANYDFQWNRLCIFSHVPEKTRLWHDETSLWACFPALNFGWNLEQRQFGCLFEEPVFCWRVSLQFITLLVETMHGRIAWGNSLVFTSDNLRTGCGINHQVQHTDPSLTSWLCLMWQTVITMMTMTTVEIMTKVMHVALDA